MVTFARHVFCAAALLFCPAFVVACVAADDSRPQASSTTQKIDGAERLIYKSVGDVELPLFVFKPPQWQAGDARPAIVFYFGGGW